MLQLLALSKRSVTGAVALGAWALIALASRPHTQDPREFLTETARHYDGLLGYELDGIASTYVRTKECKVEFPFQVSQPNPGPPSASSEVTVPPTIRFSRPSFPRVCASQLSDSGGISPPADWLAFKKVNVGVRSIRELQDQILRLGEQDVHCRMLEVEYEDYYRQLRRFGGPAHYCIEPETHLIRRIEINEALTQDEMMPWVITIFGIRTGANAPSWLSRSSEPTLGAQTGELAPDFELRTSEGKAVRLSSLRGKVVLLDFWATWCGACDEEIPILEKIQREFGPSAVVVGVSKEDATVVRAWLTKYHRSFKSLVDGSNAFDVFGIGPIPALVLVDRNGAIGYRSLGFASEDRVGEAIRKALSN